MIKVGDKVKSRNNPNNVIYKVLAVTGNLVDVRVYRNCYGEYEPLGQGLYNDCDIELFYKVD